MKRVLIVLLNILIIFTAVGMNFNVSFAGEGSISAPGSVNVGEGFTVTVSIPSDAVGYQGEISVKFSNGTTQSSGNLAVVTGLTGDYTHPGNMSYSFTAASEGNATITVSNLTITDRSGTRVNSQRTLTGNISVVKKAEPAQTPSAPAASSTPAAATSNEPSWNNTGDTVYAVETVNVRSGWGTGNASLGKLGKGSSVTRIAVGSTGWDKVSFKGQTGYIMSKYLTTQNPNGAQTTEQTTTENTNPADANAAEPAWNNTGDTVYATTSMNVRSSWGTDKPAIGSLKKGDSVTRIAVGSTGWDKIKYNGKTAYVLSKLLTTEKVEPDEDENTVDENAVDQNLTVNEQDVYNRLVEEVGVLPAVGHNFADYVYIIAVCCALIMIGYVGLKIRENNNKED